MTQAKRIIFDIVSYIAVAIPTVLIFDSEPVLVFLIAWVAGRAIDNLKDLIWEQY